MEDEAMPRGIYPRRPDGVSKAEWKVVVAERRKERARAKMLLRGGSRRKVMPPRDFSDVVLPDVPTRKKIEAVVDSHGRLEDLRERTPQGPHSSQMGDHARYFRPEPLRAGSGFYVLPTWSLNGLGYMETIVRITGEAGGALSLRIAEAEVIGQFLATWAAEERDRQRNAGFTLAG
jgi:hypothetical protein